MESKTFRKIEFRIDDIPLSLVYQHSRWHIKVTPGVDLPSGESAFPATALIDAFLNNEARTIFRSNFLRGSIVNTQDYALIPQPNESGQDWVWKVGFSSTESVLLADRTLRKLIVVFDAFLKDPEKLVTSIEHGEY